MSTLSLALAGGATFALILLTLVLNRVAGRQGRAASNTSGVASLAAIWGSSDASSGSGSGGGADGGGSC